MDSFLARDATFFYIDHPVQLTDGAYHLHAADSGFGCAADERNDEPPTGSASVPADRSGPSGSPTLPPIEQLEPPLPHRSDPSPVGRDGGSARPQSSFPTGLVRLSYPLRRHLEERYVRMSLSRSANGTRCVSLPQSVHPVSIPEYEDPLGQEPLSELVEFRRIKEDSLFGRPRRERAAPGSDTPPSGGSAPTIES